MEHSSQRISVFVRDPTYAKLKRVQQCGITSVVLPVRGVTKKIVSWLTKHNMSWDAEFPLFTGRKWWNQYPLSRPKSLKQTPMQPCGPKKSYRGTLLLHHGPEKTYYGVCPTHPDVREELLQSIEGFMSEFDPRSLILNFLRFPGRWEDDEVERYCFCPRCVSLLESVYGGEIHLNSLQYLDPDTLHTWKSEIISTFLDDVRNRLGPDRDLGVFVLPFLRGQYGQHISLWRHAVDRLYIMEYHWLFGYSYTHIPLWTQHACEEFRGPVTPVIQLFPEPEPVPMVEVFSTLRYLPRAEDVLLFHWESLGTEKEELFYQWHVEHATT